MLGFTTQSKQSSTGNKTWYNNNNNNNNKYNNNNNDIDDDIGFQPIIISNKLPRQVDIKKSNSKSIYKINNQPSYKNKQQQRQKSKQLKSLSYQQNNNNKNIKPKPSYNKQWNKNNFIPSTSTFDNKLKKNELLHQQLRLRAQLKKQKQLTHQQIIIKQKKLGTKSLKMLKDKDQQIEYLKKMIQKQKQQKQKIDKEYQIKKIQIQKERQQLIELEKRIEREGIKQKKVLQEVRKVVISPERQLGKKINHNNMNMNKQIASSTTNVRQQIQPTMSQHLHQRNIMRQKQLQTLINHRQRIALSDPVHNINYTPSLIPLLSKASYKIISTHVSQLVQLLVDDLLEQQVYLLQQIQLEQAKLREEERSKEIIKDYKNMVEGFCEENQEIRGKVGKYDAMEFTDIYKPKYYPQQQHSLSSKYKNSQFSSNNPNSHQIYRKISLKHFDQQQYQRFQQIIQRKQRFIRFVNNFDQYKKNNMRMFQDCTEELIDKIVEKLALELDKGSGEFVELVFRNQFQ